MRRKTLLGNDNRDYSGEYLTFEALQDGEFTFTIPADVDSTYAESISYSKSGSGWVTTQNDNTEKVIIVPVETGDTVMWKGTADGWTSSDFMASYFSSTANFNVSGNIMSLLYGDNFIGETNLTGKKDFAFSSLFSGYFATPDYDDSVVSIDNLVLPATTLANYCYEGMFLNCTGLTAVPSDLLPATTLAAGCYSGMFKGCTSLTAVPSDLLPATTLADGCYYGMFSGCTDLTSIPQNLLPVTTLAVNCYRAMFYECTSLVNIPSDLLPATTLANYCYSEMFYGCTSLTTVPSDLLPATTLAYGCYDNMFNGCTSLTTAPVLPATTLASTCYYYMFYNCSSLNRIKCLATNKSATACTGNWVNGVASSGTFVKHTSMSTSTWGRGVSGIPTNWSVTSASS